MRRTLAVPLPIALVAPPAADRLAFGAEALADVPARVLPAVVDLSVVKVEALTPSSGTTTARQRAMVTVGDRPEIGAPQAAMTAPEAVARARYGLAASLNQVLIALISDDTEAAEHGVQAGDVIADVDRVAVSSPDPVAGLITKAFAELRRSLGRLV